MSTEPEAPTASIQVGQKHCQLPVIVGSEGELGVDISALRSATGAMSLDWGFMNTAACESAITFLDGERGVLRYRGYAIDVLAEHSSFMETSWLLLKGELPTAAALYDFTQRVRAHAIPPAHCQEILSAMPRESHPMGMLAAILAVLSATEPEPRPQADESDDYRLLGILPTLAAWAHRRTQGYPLLAADPKLRLEDDFLRLLSPAGTPVEEPEFARALGQLLILHADHEQNCSTSTVRMVGSANTNLYASLAAGVTALWGSLHGGANQAVLEMLETITEEGCSAEQFLERVKNRQEGIRLMGFGHRVYKNFDPRGKIIKTTVDRVLRQLQREDPLLIIAQRMEEVALRDEYFIQRKLYPNVDFYSGMLYRALGIPKQMFTVMFALGRLPGWIAHWREMHASPQNRIGRPRQIYIGARERTYTPAESRG